MLAPLKLIGVAKEHGSLQLEQDKPPVDLCPINAYSLSIFSHFNSFSPGISAFDSIISDHLPRAVLLASDHSIVEVPFGEIKQKMN